MSDAAEFLKRRLDEEQAVIESSSSGKVGASPHAQMFYHHGPNYWTRVNADAAAALQLIAAHRKLLELHDGFVEKDWSDTPFCLGCGDGERYHRMDWPCETVQLLAQGWGWTS